MPVNTALNRSKLEAASPEQESIMRNTSHHLASTKGNKERQPPKTETSEVAKKEH